MERHEFSSKWEPGERLLFVANLALASKLASMHGRAFLSEGFLDLILEVSTTTDVSGLEQRRDLLVDAYRSAIEIIDTALEKQEATDAT